MATIRYQVRQPGAAAMEQILVESDDGTPRPASVVSNAARTFEDMLKPVSAAAHAVVEALKSVSPDELMVEFGVEFGGSGGIPKITSYEGKANIKVQIKWKHAPAGGTSAANP